MAEKVDILIEPYEDQAAVPQDRWRDIVLDHPDVQRLLAAADPGDVQVSAPEAIGRRKRDDAPFVATAFDPNGNHAVLITGTLDKPEQLDAQSMAFRPNPTPEELARATEVLRNDKRFAELGGRDDDRDLPADATAGRPGAGRRDERAQADARHPRPHGERRHRLVAVDLAAQTVDWEPAGIEHPVDGDCESRLPESAWAASRRRRPDRVRVRVLVDGAGAVEPDRAPAPRLHAADASARAPVSSCDRSPTAGGWCCGRRTCQS